MYNEICGGNSHQPLSLVGSIWPTRFSKNYSQTAFANWFKLVWLLVSTLKTHLRKKNLGQWHCCFLRWWQCDKWRWKFYNQIPRKKWIAHKIVSKQDSNCISNRIVIGYAIQKKGTDIIRILFSFLLFSIVLRQWNNSALSKIETLTELKL